MLAGCGGGMNASNSDAPKANKAHEALWVANHRDAILNFANYTTKTSNGETVVDGVMINEAAIQCRVCHGPTLAGDREGYNGSDCLSCHVLDPVRYPVMCYSCHGGWAIVPFDGYTTGGQGSPIILSLKQNGWPVSPLQKWFSTARAQRGSIPYDQTFVTRVRTGTSIHRKHNAIESFQYNSTLYFNVIGENRECTTCHGRAEYGTQLGTGRHHFWDKGEQSLTAKIDPITHYVVMPDEQATRPNLISIVIQPGCFSVYRPLFPNTTNCHDTDFGTGRMTSNCIGCHGKPH